MSPIAVTQVSDFSRGHRQHGTQCSPFATRQLYLQTPFQLIVGIQGPMVKKQENAGALIIRTGLGAHYTLIIIQNARNSFRTYKY